MGYFDWSEIQHCLDVDSATLLFTAKFKQVLDKHAPWKQFQQRKLFSPWLTEATLSLMKTRDELKSKAVNLSKEGKDATSV